MSHTHTHTQSHIPCNVVCFACACSDPAQSEEQLRASINQQLIESGQKERLKAMLRDELKKSNWRDRVRDLASEMVPEEVKMKLMANIQRSLRQTVDEDNASSN
ncbi:hypothetical protein PTSG_05236 [Salpingoeca rosetta]|uniref:Transcription and mRNA export factor ENY2 n=1 Tax=Salpingoeca rosetta (strain ATCC 50818 / BSB-021) TaxID=946362 RepID=F2UAW6_SALR5|nr:uncharacterized protein PTSG_05236 [Salpingoeca rosetta]EGD73532.1 hypothetical protein PTSG_05236 [Salpingoeca rosetta]|eukprot:XP_004993814.1 hypothetical protein PTSG_05236 [Salpingoeca rosetta]